MTASAIHSPAGTGASNEAFGLHRIFCVTSEDTDGATAIFEEHIPEGAGPPLHVHHKETELFVVMHASIRFRAGEADFVANPGDIVTIPPGLHHTFQGAGPGTTTALIQLTPGHASGFFAAVTAEGLTTPGDMARISELAAKYNLEFVGPPLD